MTLTYSRHRITKTVPINIMDRGAACDGTTDDTDIWNAALATGRNIFFPEGRSKITDKISFSTTRGQRIIGSGNNASEFVVGSDFNLAASCAIEIKAIGQHIECLGIECYQPSTNIRANLIEYPWIIRAEGCPSTHIHDVWINNCFKGVRLGGNCGQSALSYLKIGGFHTDLEIDGSVDTVRVNAYHSWPLDFSGDANLMAIYSDGTRLAANFGRIDDLSIGEMLSFEGRVRFSDLSAAGAPFGCITRLGLDGTAARLEMAGGNMTIASVYGTGGVVNDYKIAVTNGGVLTISALFILLVATATPSAWMYVNGFYSYLTIGTGLVFFNGDSRLFAVDNDGTLNLANITFVQRDATARGQALIDVLDGTAIVTGCKVRPEISGVGIFAAVATDAEHCIVGNDMAGWVYTLPAQQAIGTYGPNAKVVVPASGQIWHGHVRSKRFTGTLNGSGAATVAHSVALAHQRVVALSAFEIGGSGERIVLTGALVNGTDIILSGGTASAGYEIWLQYT